MNKCILIAGMHRCGTSALAGALSQAGVFFGENLLSSKKDENDLGFFEDADILELNDKFLQDLHSSWDDVRGIDFSLHEKRCKQYQSSLQELLSQNYTQQSLWCIKDPRLSVLMPLWLPVLQALGVIPRILISFRHPDEVANSLRKRNGFSFEKSALLIANYYTQIISSTYQSDRFFISYEALLDHQEGKVNNLAEFLGLDPDVLNQHISDHVHHSLKHQNVDENFSYQHFGQFEETMRVLHDYLNRCENLFQTESTLTLHLPNPPYSSNFLTNELMLTRSDISLMNDKINTAQGLPEELRKMSLQSDEMRLYFQDRSARLEEELNVSREITGTLKTEVIILQNEIKNLTSVLEDRTTWIKKMNAEMQHDRQLLVKLSSSKLNIGPRLVQLKLMAKQGIRHPDRVIPWVKRRINNQLAKRRLQQGGHLKQVVEPVKSSALVLENLSFSQANNPTLSIIIPVYNDLDYTVGCLESITELNDKIRYEVIVVDDASPDIDTSCLNNIDNITWVKNPENLGFIGTCNRGASIAKGKYLLFLNNDTRVHDGCLDALFDTFSSFEDVGLVGGKLVYPDGRLQEAGGIVWQDGSAWNWGRLQDPSRPEYNYARRVDYCSGALLMITKELFDQFGGFDTHYCPAYYEDTDLAFRVRSVGKHVYYQPKAEITHYEGVSNGTDLGSGIKKYQVVNGEKFFARWKDVLSSHRKNAELPELECDRGVDKHILVIDHRMLTPDQDSGSLRMFNLFRVLQSMGHRVTFLPDNLYAEEPYTAQLQQMGIEVIHSPYYSSVSDYLNQFGYKFDVVLLSRLFVMAKNISAVRKNCPKAKVLYDTVDLHFLREMREAELANDAKARKAAEETREHELSLMELADATIVVSPYEEGLLQADKPNLKLHTVSNIHEVHGTETGYKERADILFIGGFEHPPNADAVKWFVQEIFPIVQAKLADVKFHIIGSKPDKSVKALAEQNTSVIVHGFVEDVSDYFHNIRLTVAPLRYGAGVKGKVNQSLAYGVPCVATPIAAEGMDLNHNVDIYIAESPEAIAEGVIAVYSDQSQWELLSQGGLENIERVFSLNAAKKSLTACLS